MGSQGYLIVAGFFMVSVTMLFLHGLSVRKENQDLKRSVNYYEATYLRKNGFSAGWGNYDLQSLERVL